LKFSTLSPGEVSQWNFIGSMFLVARPFLHSISLRVFFDSGHDLVPLL
jgi:hypothetical protein